MPLDSRISWPFIPVAFALGAITSATILTLLRKSTQEHHDDVEDHHHQSQRRRTRRQQEEQEALMDSPWLDQRMIRKAEGAIRKRCGALTVVIERCTNDHNYSAILRTVEALGVQHVWIINAPQMSTIDDVVPPSNNGVEDDSEGIRATPEPPEDPLLSPQKPGTVPALHMTTRGQILQQNADEQNERQRHHLFAQKATEWLTLRNFASTAECIQQLRNTGHEIWVTDLSQEAICLTEDVLDQRQRKDPSSLLPPKLAIVFGTEAVGCTEEMLNAADERVYLPLRGFADSLNLSVATALVLHQLFVLEPRLIGSMSEEERRALRKSWFAKLAFQRLMSKRQKKEYAKLQGRVRELEELNRLDRLGKLDQPSQQEKLERYRSIPKELEELQSSLWEKAELAIADLVQNPPEPITDMRRADGHRTCFVGKKTKARYKEEWEAMPATTGYQTNLTPSTASFFRNRVSSSSTGTM